MKTIYKEYYPECFSAFMVNDIFQCRERTKYFFYELVACGTVAQIYDKNRKTYYCPICGARHSNKLGRYNRIVPIPTKIKLRILTTRDEVILRASGFYDGERPRCIYDYKFAEEFRFNFKTSRCYWSKGKNFKELGQQIDFTNPFHVDLLTRTKDQSVLSYLDSHTLVNTAEIQKVLLKEINNRLTARKRKSDSILSFAAGNSDCGKLLPLFKAIAFKIAFPDLHFASGCRPYTFINAENAIRKDRAAGFYKRNFLDQFGDLKRKFEKAFKIAEGGKDSISAIIESFSLPNKPAVRKIVKENVFHVGKIKKALDFFSNYDIAMKAYKDINIMTLASFEQTKEIVGFMYDDITLFKIMNNPPNQWGDCLYMVKALKEKNRKKLIAAKPSASNLHEWLTRTLWYEKNKDCKYKIPTHIMQRMELQIDRVKFFLPQTRYALEEAGRTLKNCVSSYHRRVIDGSCRIALLADDKGKLIAAIEIKSGDQIVQAKVYNNQPVYTDQKINDAVLKWAEDVQLKIRTVDVAVKEKIKTPVVQELRRDAV